MILSVPHSGTRTLIEHLGRNAYMHFGMHDPDIAAWRGSAHIPVRDPFDVSVSWLSRYERDPGKPPGAELDAIDKMIEYVRTHNDVTLYKIEDIAIVKGKGPKHWARDKRRRKDALEIDRLRLLREWYRGREERRQFYGKLYDGFWWDA